MDWVWTRVGVAGVLVATATLATAVMVYVAGPRRRQSRLLAALLGVMGVAVLAGSGLMYLTADPREAYAWQAVNTVCFISYLWLYPAFLSTLATPFSRRLARVRPLFYAFAVATPALWFVAPEQFVPSMRPGTFAPWDTVPGPGFELLMLAGVGVGLLGFGLAFSAHRRAPLGSLHRTQARSYLLAFGVLDVSLIGFFVLSVLSEGWVEWLLIGHLVGIAAFVALLAYGALKTQLFDIDLRLKRGVRRGTVAGTITVAFVVGSEGAELLLPVDGTLLGLAAASALAFAFRPIERWSARLADRVMPTVQPTESYMAIRKREVYRATVEEMLMDGHMSEKDRRVLARMRAQLGLSDEDARAVEEAVEPAKQDSAVVAMQGA